MAADVETWISEAPPSQQRQLRALRALILENAPDATETIKWNQPCFSQKRLFCYLQRAKTHVTLGFQYGARLDDPQSLLTGDGKLMRHINFATEDHINEAACKALIGEALRIDQSS